MKEDAEFFIKNITAVIFTSCMKVALITGNALFLHTLWVTVVHMAKFSVPL